MWLRPEATGLSLCTVETVAVSGRTFPEESVADSIRGYMYLYCLASELEFLAMQYLEYLS
jgi:hypothetical protein